jgi:hypothetical protein
MGSISTAAAMSNPACSKPSDMPPAPAKRSIPIGRLVIQEPPKTWDEAAFLLQFALPDGQDRPSGFSKFRSLASVPLLVGSNLRLPIVQSALRQATTTASVTVPVASVNEYDLAPLDERQVWSSGKVDPPKRIPVAKRVHDSPQGDLWPSIPGPNGRHDPAADFRANPVHHPLRPKSLLFETGNLGALTFCGKLPSQTIHLLAVPVAHHVKHCVDC